MILMGVCVCMLLLRFNKAMVSADDKYRFTNTANREENRIGETIKFLKTLNGMNETNVQIIGNDTQLWLQFFFFHQNPFDMLFNKSGLLLANTMNFVESV